MEEERSDRYLIPVFVVAYGDSAQEAIEYTTHAFDATWFIGEDGIYSVEVLEDEVDLYEEDI